MHETVGVAQNPAHINCVYLYHDQQYRLLMHMANMKAFSFLRHFTVAHSFNAAHVWYLFTRCNPDTKICDVSVFWRKTNKTIAFNP